MITNYSNTIKPEERSEFLENIADCDVVGIEMISKLVVQEFLNAEHLPSKSSLPDFLKEHFERLSELYKVLHSQESYRKIDLISVNDGSFKIGDKDIWQEANKIAFEMNNKSPFKLLRNLMSAIIALKKERFFPISE